MEYLPVLSAPRLLSSQAKRPLTQPVSKTRGASVHTPPTTLGSVKGKLL